MQHGATPHRTKDVFQAIHCVYGTRVIGLGYPEIAKGALKWPPYSPDMNPCDYFFWGYIKDKCYAKNPKSKERLINVIKKDVYGITIDMLEESFHSFRKRTNFQAQSNGSHFENICY